MSYRIGLVGKPSVGKSTLFNVATMNDVPEGAYPFTTIDPTVGEAYVRVDCAAPEFEHSCTPNHGVCREGTRFVPVKLVDVAGLVPGAHEGRGLGNQFLSDLNETDVLIHVVDFSWETDIEADLAEQMSAFGIVEEEVKRLILRLDIGFDPDDWDEADREDLAREIRMETKPMVIAANKMDTEKAQVNFREITADPDYKHLTFVPVSAHAEKALKSGNEQGALEYVPGEEDFEITADLPEEKREGLKAIREFVGAYGGTGVQTALETALFDVLDAIAVFPGSESPQDDGTFLQDCFVLPGGSTAEDFAYFLHTDIGDGFLHAHDVRSGRQVGAETELDHRDVIEITTTN